MACPANQTVTDLGCIPNDPAGFVSKFYGIGLSIIGGVSLLAIIYGGYLIASSRGNPSQFEKGRNYIFYAIIGILVAIFAAVVLQLVSVDVLHIPGFTK